MRFQTVHRHRTPFGVASAGDQTRDQAQDSRGVERQSPRLQRNLGQRLRVHLRALRASRTLQVRARRSVDARRCRGDGGGDGARGGGPRPPSTPRTPARATRAQARHPRSENRRRRCERQGNERRVRARRVVLRGGVASRARRRVGRRRRPRRRRNPRARTSTATVPEMYATRGVHHDTFAFNVSMFRGVVRRRVRRVRRRRHDMLRSATSGTR